ncbi:MAG: sugar phosphate isomerase/epimerase [Verrucomicrobiota bacterium]|nr:sugar phosphate isomerase/epimerase [Verrucomicrobiota bacterium]
MNTLSRRQFIGAAAAVAATPALAAKPKFRLNYILSSSMYGTLPLKVILPEAAKTGADTLDIWPRVHGNQREQMEEMGHEKFAAMLKQHKTSKGILRLGCFTRYDLGPFELQKEMAVAKKFGAKVLVCGGRGRRGLKGAELKAEVKKFAELLKPHIAAAEKARVTIAIENHSSNLINSPDSMKWLAELAPSKHLGIALAPYHLESLGVDAAGHAALIKALGNRIAMFYAWQHGMGCTKKLPKEQELLQMPGRGNLDFTPIVRALKQINYNGYTSIFMHPVPRGIPILKDAPACTTEINRARTYLEKCLAKA